MKYWMRVLLVGVAAWGVLLSVVAGAVLFMIWLRSQSLSVVLLFLIPAFLFLAVYLGAMVLDKLEGG